MGNIIKITGGEKQQSSVYIETYENGIYFEHDYDHTDNCETSLGTPAANETPKNVEQKNLPATPTTN